MLELDWSVVQYGMPLLWKGMKITFLITSLAIVFGMALGTVLAVLRLSPLSLFRWLSAFYVNCFRSVPLVMVLMWFYLVVPQFVGRVLDLSPQTDIRLISAIVAFSLFEAAYYSEIIQAGINGISRAQTQAGLALGMTGMQVMLRILLPQAFRSMTPLLLTQGIILFQDTSLVYMLGIGDFFRTATNIGKTNGCEPGMVLFAGAVYLLPCFAVSRLVDYCKRAVSLTDNAA